MNDHRPHQAMGAGHEFDTIRLLMARWGDLAVDIGDDAAVLLPEGQTRRVITTDACVEDVHFRRAWITPREVGARAAAAAISDVAAMGARAESVLIAFVVPDDWRDVLADVADGMGQVIRASGARIVGGNLSRGHAFSISTTVVGAAEHPAARRGAVVGDVLVVTGRLGGPAMAIDAWNVGREPDAWARARFAGPQPRIAEGIALAAAGAHAMLDISDGLVADARHLAAASGVSVRLDASMVPCGPGVTPARALSSGEEYELLAALPREAADALVRSWAMHSDQPLTIIGEVREAMPQTSTTTSGVSPASVDVVGLHEINGTNSTARVEFTSGHDHFSR